MRLPPEGSPSDVLGHVEAGTDIVVGMANAEPVDAIDALEDGAAALEGVRLHQMHALHPRPSIEGVFGDHLHHVSLFLSAVTRAAAQRGACSWMPVDFSAVPRLLWDDTACSLAVASASPPDDDGWCSLGTQADYTAALVPGTPLFLEINDQMPRVSGTHRVRLEDTVGWYRTSRPLVPATPSQPDALDHKIAQLVAERVPDGATIQVGIGALADAVCGALSGHRDLGLHSELFTDGAMDLIEGGVLTGARKRHRPGVAVATFALGSERLYRWLHENPRVWLERVDLVNDPHRIAAEPGMVSVNATTEVDLLGQCASETIAGRPWSGSGGQPDFAAGALASDGGQGMVVLRSTTSKGRSRIRSLLTPGSVVTTPRNLVDHVITEWGVASLRGRTTEQRAAALIRVADPAHREALEREARDLGLLPRGSSAAPGGRGLTRSARVAPDR